MFYLQKTVTEKQNATADSAAAEISKLCNEISFNPNVFTDFKLGGTEEVCYVTYKCFALKLCFNFCLTDLNIIFWGLTRRFLRMKKM